MGKSSQYLDELEQEIKEVHSKMGHGKEEQAPQAPQPGPSFQSGPYTEEERLFIADRRAKARGEAAAQAEQEKRALEKVEKDRRDLEFAESQKVLESDITKAKYVLEAAKAAVNPKSMGTQEGHLLSQTVVDAQTSLDGLQTKHAEQIKKQATRFAPY